MHEGGFPPCPSLLTLVERGVARSKALASPRSSPPPSSWQLLFTMPTVLLYAESSTANTAFGAGVSQSLANTTSGAGVNLGQHPL